MSSLVPITTTDPPDPDSEWRPGPAGDRSRFVMKSLRTGSRQARRRAVRVLVTSYLGYAALSFFAPGVAARPVGGGFTVGLLAGFAQIAVVAAVTVRYGADMARRVDPLADAVRATAGEPVTDQVDDKPEGAER